jgi:hypothetical protein
MKKVLIACSIVFFAVFANAQSWNPYVNQGIVSSVMLPSEFDGSGEVSFNIGNTGSDPISFKQNDSKDNLSFVVTLKNGVPDKNNPVASIGGTWKSFFDWSYDSANNTFTAVQKRTIPGSAQGSITLNYKVTDNTAMAAAANGFMVNLKTPAYMAGRNNSQDDVVSSYSFTRAYDYGSAPMSYGSARHEINLLKDNSGRYMKYIFLGKKVDPEQDELNAGRTVGNNKKEDSDNDGINFPVLTAGQTASIQVEVTAHHDSYGVLNAWFDWNADGDFNDPGEKVINPLAVYSSGNYIIQVDVPVDAVTSQPTFARFRIGANSGPTASNSWGEVEDYQIFIESNNLADTEITQPVSALENNDVFLSGERKYINVLLSWEILTEENVAGFLIERSINGSEFEKIGETKIATGIAGNQSPYSYVDQDVKGEIAIYRIRMIGNDRSEKISNSITEILENRAFYDISVFPNPIHDYYNVTINKPGSYHLELLDVNGRIVSIGTMEVSAGGFETKQFARENNIVAGSYFIRVVDKNDGGRRTFKVILSSRD